MNLSVAQCPNTVLIVIIILSRLADHSNMGVPTLLVLAVLSFDKQMACPSGYYGAKGECLKYITEPKGWYSAELGCRRDGGHLMEFQSKVHMELLLEDYKGPPVWLGVTGESGEWKFSSNDLLDKSLPQYLLSELNKPVPGSHCVIFTEKGLVTDKCFASYTHFCQLGVNNCIWNNGRKLAFDEGEDHFTISNKNIVSKNGEEIGIGEWYSHNTFRLAATSSTVACNWIARFISDSLVECGCEGALSKARWNPQPNCFGKDTSQEGVDVNKPSTGQAGAAGSIENVDENVKSNTLPVTKGPTTSNMNETLSKDLSSRETDKSDSSLPLWMWPLTFVAVAGVSTVAALGVLKKKRDSQDSGSGDDVSLGHQMMPIPPVGEPKPKSSRPCDICRKFNETTARQRLQSVHDALTKELSMPLVVSGTRCDHVGGEHIHVFNVENEFDSHTLGALSTVYSRTKPRLPRNTRIHILHKKERQKLQDGSDFAADHVYIADAYY